MRNIRLYADHRKVVEADSGTPTIELCDECAEKRGGDVALWSELDPGFYCSDCGRADEITEAADVREAREFFQDEPGTRQG